MGGGGGSYGQGDEAEKVEAVRLAGWARPDTAPVEGSNGRVGLTRRGTHLVVLL
jgi:hypothetical protein